VGRHLLDTSIISNITKPAPSEALVAWMGEQNDEDLFISSLTVAEILRGLLEKPAGKKRRRWSAGSPVPKARKRFSPAACSRSMRMPASSGRG
jgi:toxin FitB